MANLRDVFLKSAVLSYNSDIFIKNFMLSKDGIKTFINSDIENVVEFVKSFAKTKNIPTGVTYPNDLLIFIADIYEYWIESRKESPSWLYWVALPKHFKDNIETLKVLDKDKVIDFMLNNYKDVY